LRCAWRSRFCCRQSPLRDARPHRRVRDGWRPPVKPHQDGLCSSGSPYGWRCANEIRMAQPKVADASARGTLPRRKVGRTPPRRCAPSVVVRRNPCAGKRKDAVVDGSQGRIITPAPAGGEFGASRCQFARSGPRCSEGVVPEAAPGRGRSTRTVRRWWRISRRAWGKLKKSGPGRDRGQEVADNVNLTSHWSDGSEALHMMNRHRRRGRPLIRCRIACREVPPTGGAFPRTVLHSPHAEVSDTLALPPRGGTS